MRAPGSGPRDGAAPRGSVLALPYLPLGPQQAEKLPAPEQQHPRHLDGKRPSVRTCALGAAAPRAGALLETGGRSLAAMLEAGEKGRGPRRHGRAGRVFGRMKSHLSGRELRSSLHLQILDSPATC